MAMTRIICAGFGGQGIMFLGKLIAAAAMTAGKHVTCMPSYGAEQRGGTAHSMVIISDGEIPSPIVGEADICIVMNKPSFDKFQSMIKKGGTLILNSSLIESQAKRKDIKIVRVPATEIAYSLGNVKVANIVTLGALISKTKIVPKDDAASLLEEAFANKKELLESNKQAFKKGLEHKE